MTGPKKGSRGHAPKRNTAQGRGGSTRDTVTPARGERTTSRGSVVESAGSGKAGGTKSGARTTGGNRAAQTERRSGGARAATNPARRGPTERSTGERGTGERSAEGRGTDSRGERKEGTGSAGRTFKPAPGRKPPPRMGRKPLPELKRVQLDSPPPDTVFVDRDGEKLTFPESNLKRAAAALLSEKKKAWRYRPFAFPLFSDSGNESAFHFDFYIYDYEDSVIRLIMVIPFESREVWDKVGRFKRQYPMYDYELWTPEKLGRLSGPRGRLEF
ncbi:hypothetical protein [Deinococcus arenicola]|uniref:Uncharacterized protein n=1 Tax=Deinococcus arenicola TaxID=2994950 RepID=A0ABU4DTF3_9DEIO|nr:hypothetical protein [Deinococcus sp. ZS9-10]MDV6374959.1 hypothetical protein [Deinococcus sp. ZS9-10]